MNIRLIQSNSIRQQNVHFQPNVMLEMIEGEKLSSYIHIDHNIVRSRFLLF
jgi:hypothetical protein